MFAKVIIVVLLVAILVALFSSMVFLVKDPSSRKRTLMGLKIRIGLSITLLLFVLLSYYMGWIQPHGIVP